MQSRAARFVRGSVIGAFATVVAAALHVSAGGRAPGGLAIGLALVFATLLGVLVIGRRPSLPRLSIAVAATQAAFHLGFTHLGTDAAVASAGSAHHPSIAFTASAAHSAHTDDPAMWLAHLAAGALTIGFLFFAERALWGMLEAAAAFVVRALRMPQLELPAGRARSNALASRTATFAAQAVISWVSRRGPPAPSPAL